MSAKPTSPLNENENRANVGRTARSLTLSGTTLHRLRPRSPSRLSSGHIWGILARKLTCSPNQITAPTGSDSWTSTCTIRSNASSGEV
jgi:hypothetical protein